MRFLVVDGVALRDGTLTEVAEYAKAANVDFMKIAMNKHEAVDFETTARINHFFAVTRLEIRDGKAIPISSFYARVPDEIFKDAEAGGVVAYRRVDVFPFLPIADRVPRGAKTAA